MPSIDFKVYCAKCNEYLGLFGVKAKDNSYINITPCPKCIDDSYDKGYEEGRQTLCHEEYEGD